MKYQNIHILLYISGFPNQKISIPWNSVQDLVEQRAKNNMHSFIGTTKEHTLHLLVLRLKQYFPRLKARAPSCSIVIRHKTIQREKKRKKNFKRFFRSVCLHNLVHPQIMLNYVQIKSTQKAKLVEAQSVEYGRERDRILFTFSMLSMDHRTRIFHLFHFINIPTSILLGRKDTMPLQHLLELYHAPNNQRLCHYITKGYFPRRDKVQVVESYVYSDIDKDVFQREPFIAMFRTKNACKFMNADFVNIHLFQRCRCGLFA